MTAGPQRHNESFLGTFEGDAIFQRLRGSELKPTLLVIDRKSKRPQNILGENKINPSRQIACQANDRPAYRPQPDGFGYYERLPDASIEGDEFQIFKKGPQPKFPCEPFVNHTATGPRIEQDLRASSVVNRSFHNDPSAASQLQSISAPRLGRQT